MNDTILQILSGMIGALGFAILLGVNEKRTYFLIAICSSLGWAIYLLATDNGLNMYVGLLLTSLFVNAYSVCWTRLFSIPTASIMLPSIIVEVPGGTLYYAIFAWIKKDMVSFNNLIDELILSAGAIALGIIVVAFTEQFIHILIGWIRKEKRHYWM